jgi:hypothetical protein
VGDCRTKACKGEGEQEGSGGAWNDMGRWNRRWRRGGLETHATSMKYEKHRLNSHGRTCERVGE